MKNGKITLAWLWSRYEGLVSFGAPIVLCIDPKKYRKICIYLMKNSEKPNYLEKNGYRAFYISEKKFLRAFNLWIIWKLSRVLKSEKVDILHCNGHQATIYGTIAAKIAGVPVVFSHAHGLNRSQNPRRKLINYFVLRYVDKILTVSEAVKRDVLKSNPIVRSNQVVCLNNSIDYKRFAEVSVTKQQAKDSIGLKADSFVFGTVGRHASTKGQSYLVDAFASIKRKIPKAHLLFVGDGQLRCELEKKASEAELTDSIHFLGRREDIPELLKAMDCFVLPSITEGMPGALLEAMAAGVPCIASEVGGIPEVITNDETGFLVPPKDAEALAETMSAIARMPQQELEEVVKRARQRVQERYDHGGVIEKIQGFYEQAYAESKHNHPNI